MRRKLVAVMLAVTVVSTSLAGCGGSNTDQKESKKAQTTTVDKKSTDMKDESKEEVKEDKKVASETTKEEETSKKSDSVKEESKKEESKKEESKKDESKKSDSKENASKKSNSKKDTSTKTTTASKTSSSSSNSNKKQEITKPSASKPSSSTSTGSNKGNSSQTNTKPAHQHNYVAQTHTVHHDAAGHNEQYVVQAAYDEQVTTYENYAWDCCNVCGADCTADPWGHMEKHALAYEGGGYHTEYSTRPVTKTVHHDPVYGTRWVQDSAAYDETVVDGYVCSCGARK